MKEVINLNTTKTCRKEVYSNGMVYLSYSTPILCVKGNVIFENNKKYSVTTSRQKTVYMFRDLLKQRPSFNTLKVSPEQLQVQIKELV